MAAALILAACNQQPDDKSLSSEEIDRLATARQAAAPEANDPFAEIETQLRARLAAAQGENIDRAWALKMIALQRTMIQLSNVEVFRGRNPRAKELARESAHDVAREIARFEALVDRDSPPAT